MAKKTGNVGESREAATTSTVQLSTNPVIAAIDPEPMDCRHYAVLVGYVGEVSSDTVQIYPQLDMRTYFQIPRNAIVFAEPVNSGQQSSPTKLVVDATAQIDVVKVNSRSIEAGFLAGAIAASNLGAARAQVRDETNPPRPVTAIVALCVPYPIPPRGGPPLPPPPPPSQCGRPCISDPLEI